MVTGFTGCNLDRYQTVKGWLDAKGNTQKKVYDVVWGDDRKPGKDGCPRWATRWI
jgi:hypothetical protein